MRGGTASRRAPYPTATISRRGPSYLVNHRAHGHDFKENHRQPPATPGSATRGAAAPVSFARGTTARSSTRSETRPWPPRSRPRRWDGCRPSSGNTPAQGRTVVSASMPRRTGWVEIDPRWSRGCNSARRCISDDGVLPPRRFAADRLWNTRRSIRWGRRSKDFTRGDLVGGEGPRATGKVSARAGMALDLAAGKAYGGGRVILSPRSPGHGTPMCW